MICIFASISFCGKAYSNVTHLYKDTGCQIKVDYPKNIYSNHDLDILPNEKTDISDKINHFIDTVASPAMLVFETGEYIFETPLVLKSDIILSGYNSDLTNFIFDFDGNAKSCININGNANSGFTKLDLPPQLGNKTLITTISNNLKTGDLIEIRQSNGVWDSKPADWAKNSVGQYLTVESISQDTIHTNESVYIDYDANLSPEIRKINPIENVIIQYLKIERLDEPESGAGYNINISKAYNCLVRGIESYKSVGSHIMISGSKNCEVNGSYIHDAFTFDGSGTRGYGVTLNDHCSDCKVENNILRRLRHAIVAKHGANGNVISYNYALETKRSEPIPDFAGDIQLHGHYAYANLIESNIVNNIWIDDYWGPSGPRNIFLRNRTLLYGFFCSSSTTDSLIILANEITGKGFTYGLFSVQGSYHQIYNNNIKGNIEHTDTTEKYLHHSMLYTTEPDFWDIFDPFPSIGYPYYDEFTIPAKNRYESENRKTYGEYLPTDVAEYRPDEYSNIYEILKAREEQEVSVYNYLGKEIYKGKCIDLDLLGLKIRILFIRLDNKLYKVLI